MTPEAAVYALVGDATGLPVYAEGHVPEERPYPFATVAMPVLACGQQAGVTVDLWHRDAGEAVPNAAARSLEAALGRGGRVLACDAGAVWIAIGSPFCQPVTDPDGAVERRHINLTAELLPA